MGISEVHSARAQGLLGVERSQPHCQASGLIWWLNSGAV